MNETALFTLIVGGVTSVAWTRVSPDFGAVGGAGLGEIVGALLTYGLVFSVASLIVSASIWAVAWSAGNWHTAQKAQTGTLVALGGAVLTGAATALANWLLNLGATL